MNRFQIGIALETTGLPLKQAVPAAGRAGADGIQIDAIGDLNPATLTATGRREIRSLIRSSELTLAALNCPLRRGLDSAEDLQPRLDHLRKVMQLAIDLGCRMIVAPLPKLDPEPTSPRAVILREAIHALASHGDKLGVVIALEPGLDAGTTVRDYFATFDIGSLAVTFDPANYLLNGFDPLVQLPAFAGKLAYTHARDARTTSVSGRGTEVPVGAGDLDWLTYIATLEMVDYRGYLTVDREPGPTRFADVVAGIKFLRRFAPATGMR